MTTEFEISPDQYSMKFGKCKNMKLADILNIKTIDKFEKQVMTGENIMNGLLLNAFGFKQL